MKRVLMLFFIACLLASIAFNGILLYSLKKYYAQSRLAAVFPTHEAFYRVANQKLPAKTQKRVVLFGDSRIQEWQNLPQIEGVEFINRGIGGETTAQLRARLNSDVLQLQPDVVIIQMGINDLVTLGVAAEHQHKAITQQCRENLEFVVSTLLQRGIRLILLTIIPPTQPPLLRRWVWSDAIAKHVEEINQAWLSEVVVHPNPLLHLIDTQAILKNATGQWHPQVNRDTLHLTTTGYERLNQAILPLLK